MEYNELCMKACSNAKWKWKWSCSVVSDSLRPYGLQPTRLLHPWDFTGKSAGVDCHFLLQGIFPTQESNPGLPHCKQTLYRLSHQESFLKLETINSSSKTWHSGFKKFENNGGQKASWKRDFSRYWRILGFRQEGKQMRSSGMWEHEGPQLLK